MIRSRRSPDPNRGYLRAAVAIMCNVLTVKVFRPTGSASSFSKSVAQLATLPTETGTSTPRSEGASEAVSSSSVMVTSFSWKKIRRCNCLLCVTKGGGCAIGGRDADDAGTAQYPGRRGVNIKSLKIFRRARM